MHPARRVCGGRHPGVGFAAAGARRAVREGVVNVSGGKVVGVSYACTDGGSSASSPSFLRRRSRCRSRPPSAPAPRSGSRKRAATSSSCSRRRPPATAAAPRRPATRPERARASSPPLTGCARLPRLPRRPSARRARPPPRRAASHHLLLSDRVRRLRRPPDRRAGRRAPQRPRWRGSRRPSSGSPRARTPTRALDTRPTPTAPPISTSRRACGTASAARGRRRGRDRRRHRHRHPARHPSFADTRPTATRAPPTTPSRRWNGTCQAGPGFTAADCNNKLIGARFFVDGFGAANSAPASFLSPRDDNGHGSHTASTAAGNFGVDPTIDGNDLGVDRISGIAPRARVAAYKVCWTGGRRGATAARPTTSTAAIDAAVADGVDVINYSVGGDLRPCSAPTRSPSWAPPTPACSWPTPPATPARAPTRSARRARCRGSPRWRRRPTPAPSARRRRSPTRPAPTSPSRAARRCSRCPRRPLVDAGTPRWRAATAEDAELCQAGTLDPAKVAGKVVLCLRGVNDRIEKSKVVSDAGGVGMILYNAADPQDLSAIPVLDPDRRADARGRPAGEGGDRRRRQRGEGSITARHRGGDGAARCWRRSRRAARRPRCPTSPSPTSRRPAWTSSRRPPTRPRTRGDSSPGRLFQVISGTSMSSPHVAGAGALLTQLHPTFSPAALKSSLMTSADADVKREDGTTPADPFDAGSGQIDPNARR